MRKVLIALVLLSATPWSYAVTIEPAPAVLVFASPGYVQLDGRWYDFEVSSGQPVSHGTRISAQPIRDGFFLDGFLSARDCQSDTGGGLLLTGLLEHSETISGLPQGAIPLYRRTGPVPVRSSVVVRSCPGATPVLQIASVHGDLSCTGEIAAPFTAEECPPRKNPAIIFDSGFTPPDPAL